MIKCITLSKRAISFGVSAESVISKDKVPDLYTT